MTSYYKTKGQLAKKTLLSRESHKKLFAFNNINLSDELYFVGKANSILDNMKDKKGKFLKNGYKAQLAITLKHIFPTLDVDIKRYKIKSKQERRLEDPGFIDKLLKLAEYAAKKVDVITRTKIVDLGQYETCITILLIVSTAMRINDILQLRLINLDEILKNTLVSITIKGGVKTRFIPKNEILTSIINHINKNREKVENFLKYSLSNKDVKRVDRINNHFVITSSESLLFQKLKQESALNTIKIPILGFNSFRKLTTTILIKNGGLGIASALNNHSDINTTEEYYNIASSDAVGRVFSKLNEAIENHNKNENEQEMEVDEQITQKNNESTASTSYENLPFKDPAALFYSPQFTPQHNNDSQI